MLQQSKTVLLCCLVASPTFSLKFIRYAGRSFIVVGHKKVHYPPGLQLTLDPNFLTALLSMTVVLTKKALVNRDMSLDVMKR